LQKCLALWPELSELAFELISQYPTLTPGFHTISLCGGRIKLTLMLGDVNECYEQLLLTGGSSLEQQLLPKAIDAWFLDGFSPAVNPLMWNQTLLSTIASLSCDKTTLATFSSAGDVRRGLIDAGFDVKKSVGFGRKREMITALFLKKTKEELPCVNKKPLTPWAIATPEPISYEILGLTLDIEILIQMQAHLAQAIKPDIFANHF